MAGIYIHIPFCRRKCHYCNFFSLASQKLKPRFLEALKREIELSRDYLGAAEIQTVYFGGGTPSVFRPGELEPVIRSLTGGTGEFTLELNPEDVTEAYVEELKNNSFNRFSLGVQSFFDDDLAGLNRSHSAGQSVRAVKLLKDAGFGNISIDLIYGIPGSSDERWKQNLETAFSLRVPHISAYALTVEQKTPLAWMISRKRLAPVDEEAQVRQFGILMEEAVAHGFQQYEISNFALPGMHAVHNTNYWKGVPYLGLGPSAHSYNGRSRRWNVANLTGYIDALAAGKLPFEEEILTPRQKYNEYVMTSLRTMWGCSISAIRADFGPDFSDFFQRNAAPIIEQGFLSENSGIYILTGAGKLLADRIASELFIVD